MWTDNMINGILAYVELIFNISLLHLLHQESQFLE